MPYSNNVDENFCDVYRSNESVGQVYGKKEGNPTEIIIKKYLIFSFIFS